MEIPAGLTCVAATAAVLLVPACAPAAAPQATQVAEQFVTAVRDGDQRAACELLDPQVKDTLESLSNRSCDQVLAAMELSGEPVTAADVWGDAAQVRTSADTLFLRQLSDGWRITGAGCRPQGERPYDCEVGGP